MNQDIREEFNENDDMELNKGQGFIEIGGIKIFTKI